ncbi:MAG: N-acetylmuramic acid 6-phosphate etherase [Verrucomicrobia bacterium]|nr:N-acetylmuramic acid 6-phosphate etherase [Verrucomicrobiota bacterium]NDD81037.1 N-acetylmuramic acid 6-phosphate etherase [Verrucomicrobiota bacterium]
MGSRRGSGWRGSTPPEGGSFSIAAFSSGRHFGREVKQGNVKENGPVLGIEGGGTKTRWILLDARGRPLAHGIEGPGNVLQVGRDRLRKMFQRISQNLPRVPVAIGGGFAGARGKAEFETVRSALHSVWPKVKKISVGQDTDSALSAAWGQGDGFLVIAGTGSNVVARIAGKKQSAGGHGHLLGDAGSGYDIAQRALRAVYRERDRSGKPPPLAAGLLAHAGAADLDRLLREVYRPHGKEWFAGFAPVVLRAAARGDRLAQMVVREAAGELAERLAELVARRRVRRPRVALTGGLFESPYYRRQFSQATAEHLPGAQLSLLKTPGEVGAVKLVGASGLNWSHPAQEKFVDVEALPTERANSRSRGLHKKSVSQLVRLFVGEEAENFRALRKAAPEIGRAAGIVSTVLQRGGRLFYVGAGTSGRLGVLDASEMPPTFHADPEEVQAILAGGPEAIFRAQEGAEDDAGAGARAIIERRVAKKDVVVGLTASGRTPFVQGALRQAAKAGAKTVLVTAHSRWKADQGGIRPDAVVRLDVGPELIAGSTRLKAGTVTKVVCNILSSVAMIRLGRVHDNLMVNVVPSNAKLRARATRLVRMLTGVDGGAAALALRKGDGKVMKAVSLLKGAKA